MPIFVSYSHSDKDFAHRLATRLVADKANVWVDEWELHVGDSITRKIEDALEDASALIVVLSQASVESEWVRRELSAGLIRELEERRVVVLPVLLEDCEIPLFLRDKKYADFRDSYDEGWKDVKEAVARVTSEGLGRYEEPEFHIDWAVDWFLGLDDQFRILLTMVEQTEDQPYTVLSEISVIANDVVTRRYLQYEEAGVGFFGRELILETVRELDGLEDMTMLLEDQMPKIQTVTWTDPDLGAQLDIEIMSRRLGEDTGRDIVLHLGKQIAQILDYRQDRFREPSEEELERIREVVDASHA